LLALIASAACKGETRAANDSRGPAAVPGADITVIGCVKPAEPPAAGSVGTSGSTDTNDSKYTLDNAKSASNSASSYRLIAGEAMLAPEVGHQVEIVAAVDDPDAKQPKLKVATIKTMAVPCP
jgi:hypothetical protein